MGRANDVAETGGKLETADKALQLFNPIALQWAALLTNRAIPTTGGSVAERTIGSKIDPWALAAVAGFVVLGVWLVSRGR